jgi:hypothetical protein
MNKVFGLISDFAPVREEGSRIVVSYDLAVVDDNKTTWIEVYLPKKQTPSILTLKMVKEAIIEDINAQTDEKILSGFVWNNKPVWLSKESQFDFKAAYDLAVQTEGASLPVKFKLGEDENGDAVYHTFNALNSFTDFYTKAIAYINQCLNDGWTKKDGIDWTPYEALFPQPEQQTNVEE